MRRKIYFFLDRLQISRNERIVLAVCGAVLILLTLLNVASERTPEYDPELYRELELLFEERSRASESENRAILARYRGEIDNDSLMAPADTVSEPPGRDVERDTLQPEAGGEGKLVVDINRADVEVLQELPGIGPVYASRILEWREQHGNFTETEQLLEIRGIGERRLEILLPYIRIEESPAGERRMSVEIE
ncbi:MAG: helix-hairpin-helix domain-containing protein [Balneolaceae bacterium]